MHQVLIGVLLVALASAADLTFTEIQVGDFTPYKQTRNCTAYHTILNYKRSQLSILPTSMVSGVMWTNVKLDECNSETIQLCPMRSVVCGTDSGKSTTHVSIGTCVDDLYVYIWDPEHARKDVENVIMVVSYVNTTLSCDSVAETDYTMCGAKSERECDMCEGPCRTAICSELKPERDQGILCLPANTTDKEVADRCTAFYHNQGWRWKRDCDKTVITGDIGGLYGALSGVLIVLFLALFLSVLWYNFMLKRTGHAPLHCPRLCPDMLFPREPQQAKAEERSAFYQPPEFYSD